MARTKGKSTSSTPAPQTDQWGESISGYFRKIFEENPKLLKGRSNEELLKRWLADHPDHKEVTEKVKNNLANVKSVLRKKSRKKPQEEQPVAAVSEVAKPKVAPKGLEALEEQIDDCLSFAKNRTGRDWTT